MSAVGRVWCGNQGCSRQQMGSFVVRYCIVKCRIIFIAYEGVLELINYRYDWNDNFTFDHSHGSLSPHKLSTILSSNWSTGGLQSDHIMTFCPGKHCPHAAKTNSVKSYGKEAVSDCSDGF